jgi:hypothetical protein
LVWLAPLTHLQTMDNNYDFEEAGVYLTCSKGTSMLKL